MIPKNADIEGDCGVYFKRRVKREFTTNTTASNQNETNYDNETEDATNYIIGGRFANPGEFPWQVHLKIYYDRNAYYYTTCGGQHIVWCNGLL
ncbi:hypothetical protein B4U80_13761 [Leptotrombidium deliense]|uniref:Uncharacterized protein n=1 Tax=Leptotrombidium deliense TaxID=299467 RepID=A0A443SG06_9ACAR|nr:hypothetical protein B4U80_13761 [Leptotrombidium deliense]